MKTKIFLTGFRGSGKTTLAELLAEKLVFELIEMDKLLVKRAGKSIAELTENGKDWFPFRLLESEVLKDIIKKENIVVATGGGLFVNDVEFSPGITFGEYNYNLVRHLAEKLIIFLKVREEVLKERLRQSYNKNFRPPLKGKEFKIEKEIEVYRKRLPLYQKTADFILDTSNQKPKESLKEILKILSK